MLCIILGLAEALVPRAYTVAWYATTRNAVYFVSFVVVLFGFQLKVSWTDVNYRCKGCY